MYRITARTTAADGHTMIDLARSYDGYAHPLSHRNTRLSTRIHLQDPQGEEWVTGYRLTRDDIPTELRFNRHIVSVVVTAVGHYDTDQPETTTGAMWAQVTDSEYGYGNHSWRVPMSAIWR